MVKKNHLYCLYNNAKILVAFHFISTKHFSQFTLVYFKSLVSGKFSFNFLLLSYSPRRRYKSYSDRALGKKVLRRILSRVNYYLAFIKIYFFLTFRNRIQMEAPRKMLTDLKFSLMNRLEVSIRAVPRPQIPRREMLQLRHCHRITGELDWTAFELIFLGHLDSIGKRPRLHTHPLKAPSSMLRECPQRTPLGVAPTPLLNPPHCKWTECIFVYHPSISTLREYKITFKTYRAFRRYSSSN